MIASMSGTVKGKFLTFRVMQMTVRATTLTRASFMHPMGADQISSVSRFTACRLKQPAGLPPVGDIDATGRTGYDSACSRRWLASWSAAGRSASLLPPRRPPCHACIMSRCWPRWSWRCSRP